MSIHEKAEHVRAAKRGGDAGGHHCHWPGCPRRVPPAMWGCSSHWFKLPPDIRSRIWRTYRVGQEDSKTPSGDYIEAAKDAQAWIAKQQKGQLL